MTTTNAPMTNGQPLQFDPAKLADIHLPESIELWPLAPGWWILLIAVVLATWLLMRFLKLRATKQQLPTYKQFKKLALDELSRIRLLVHTGEQLQTAIKATSVFLRRYALSFYLRNEVAAVTEQQWLELLDKITHSNKFTTTYAQLLTAAPYKKTVSPEQKQQLHDLLDFIESIIQNSSASQYQQGKTHV